MKELTLEEMEMMTDEELKIIALEKKKKGKKPVATRKALLAAEVLFERTHTTTATGELFPFMGATGEFEEEVFREEFTF